MLHLVGEREVLATIVALSKRFLAFDGAIDRATVAEGYRRFLRYHQPDVPTPTKPGFEFVTSETIRAQLVRLFRVDSPLNDRHQDQAIDDSAPSPEFMATQEERLRRF